MGSGTDPKNNQKKIIIKYPLKKSVQREHGTGFFGCFSVCWCVYNIVCRCVAGDDAVHNTDACHLNGRWSRMCSVVASPCRINGVMCNRNMYVFV